MPTYEYQCAVCGHQLEAFQKISEAPLEECPKCHQPALTKLVSATNFQLKGTGWYVTDVRDKNKPKPESSADKKESSTPANNTKKEGSSTDSGSKAS